MTTYTIEVTHDKEGVTVVVKDLDPDTMEEDRAAIEYALEEALHNRLIVAEFNLEQVEEELCRLREENETLRARLAQPEREWVNLTDDEIRIAWGPYFSRGVDVARVIEALLKKRNT